MMVQHDAHVFEWAFAMAIEAIERGIEDEAVSRRVVDQLGNQSVRQATWPQIAQWE